MENEVVERDYEPKPGFALVKYGTVFTFSFNNEFAQRLKNVLADFHKNHNLSEPVLSLFKNISYYLELPDGEEPVNDVFIINKLEHVYVVICERKFAESLNQVLNNFLVQKRVSPALFSFIRQLEGALYPKRFDAKTRYADEF